MRLGLQLGLFHASPLGNHFDSLLAMVHAVTGIALALTRLRGQRRVGMSAMGALVAAAIVATLERLKSLVAEDPRTVYYHGRGFHLHYTWNVLLPQHPLGAGLLAFAVGAFPLHSLRDTLAEEV